jgi:hypothetical protein
VIRMSHREEHRDRDVERLKRDEIRLSDEWSRCVCMVQALSGQETEAPVSWLSLWKFPRVRERPPSGIRWHAWGDKRRCR